MEEINLNEPWLGWAMELQSLAQAGLEYSENVYDRERFQRIRDISAEMLSLKTGIPLGRVKDLFCCEQGYQTPKIDTRAVVIENGKILLVQENDGTWSIPGGWMDITETVRSNTEKEAREEAGLGVRAERVIALHDRKRRNYPEYAYNICKIFVLCRRIGGGFKPNSETVASGWFAPDALPDIATGKNTAEQIKMCFAAAADPDWQVEFD